MGPKPNEPQLSTAEGVGLGYVFPVCGDGIYDSQLFDDTEDGIVHQECASILQHSPGDGTGESNSA